MVFSCLFSIIKLSRRRDDPRHTVWMKSLTIFAGALNLLHHHKSNLAHILVLKHLVIEFLNPKRRAKNNLKMNDYIHGQEICTLLRLYGELVKFIIGQKYYLLDSLC